MEGLERIKEQIEQRAERRIQAIEKRAEGYIKEQKALAEDERRALLQEAKDNAEKDAAALHRRAMSLAETNQRKALLQKRQDLLDQLIDEALNELFARAEDSKVESYLELIQTRGLTGGVLRLSAAEEAVGKALVERLGAAFELGEPAAIRGGFLLEDGPRIENLSYDLVLRRLRSELAGEAAEELFSKGQS